MSDQNISSWKESFLSSTPFITTQAYKDLTVQAESPPDLRDEKFLTQKRLTKYQSHAADFRLLYGFERFDDAILENLKKLCQERKVFEQMRAMLQGFPVNWIEGEKSENRAVLHTSMRALTVFDAATSLGKESVQNAQIEKDHLADVIEDISSHFDTILFIGIGGSELGPHAICEAVKPYWKKGKRVFYAGNVDPDELTNILSIIDPKKTVVAIVSKSGTTLETATNEARVRQFFLNKVASVRDHFIAITCPNTPMDNPADYKACLHLFDYVGGRYSTTSMVGGLLIGFMAGVEVFHEFLDGAYNIDQCVLEESLEKNIPLMMALISIWNRNFLGYPTTAVIPYSTALHRFPAHLQQCDMESNGKSVLRTGKMADFKTGPIVWGEPGTNAQHSFFQLLHQGTDIIPVEFIGFRKAQYSDDFIFRTTSSHEKLLANMIAQALALSQGQKNENPNKQFLGNRPSLILFGEKLTPKSLGALLAIYEHKIAFQGFIYGINSFDQEGVQLGKVLADRFLGHIPTYMKREKEKALEPLSSVEDFLLQFIL